MKNWVRAMTRDENNMLTGVSPGTPLHRPLSRFWYPVLRSAKLKDRHTHRVRLLGENFVVARRGDEVLAVDELCPHRLTSMALARVEDGGLRCIYHGWLLGCDGTVKETPNERETGGRPKLRLRAPGVREAAGLIWLNIAEASERAPFPDWPWLAMSDTHRVIMDVAQTANWIQTIEGALDSTHTTTLHQDNVQVTPVANSTVVSDKGVAVTLGRPSSDKFATMQVRETESGFVYGALRRSLDQDVNYVRATAFAFPGYVAFTVAEPWRAQLIMVPVDETHAHFYTIWYSVAGPMDHAARAAWSGLTPDALDDNGYLKICELPNWGQDREAMISGKSFCGLNGINVQDSIVQESMGAIADRTLEHLGPADVGIVHFRRFMLSVARGEAAAAQPAFAVNMRYNLRSRDGLVPANQDWTAMFPEGEVNWSSKSVKGAQPVEIEAAE